MNLTEKNPTGRFTGRGETYQRFRPGYPEEAINLIVRQGGLGNEAILVDVGCGTGISSRLFAAHGVRVIGIEPNADMRIQAQSIPTPAGEHAPEFRDGRAEETGLPDSVARLVLAAQAFHWFQPERALREFHRILNPGGHVALMWNERDENDAFTAAYGNLLRQLTDMAAVEGSRQQSSGALLGSSLFMDPTTYLFASDQVLDEDALLGRAFSASYVPQEGKPAERVTHELRELFARFQQGGTVTMLYETSVYLARRREGVRP